MRAGVFEPGAVTRAPGAVTRALVVLVATFVLALREALAEPWRWAEVDLGGPRVVRGQVRGAAGLLEVRELSDDGSLVARVYVRPEFLVATYEAEEDVREAMAEELSILASADACKAFHASPIAPWLCRHCASPAEEHRLEAEQQKVEEPEPSYKRKQRVGFRAAPGVLQSEASAVVEEVRAAADEVREARRAKVEEQKVEEQKVEESGVEESSARLADMSKVGALAVPRIWPDCIEDAVDRTHGRVHLPLDGAGFVRRLRAFERAEWWLALERLELGKASAGTPVDSYVRGQMWDAERDELRRLLEAEHQHHPDDVAEVGEVSA